MSKNILIVSFILLVPFIGINVTIFLALYILKLKELITKRKVIGLALVTIVVLPIISMGSLAFSSFVRNLLQIDSLILLALVYLVISAVFLYFLALFYWRLDKKTSFKFSALILSVFVVVFSGYFFYEKVYLQHNCFWKGGRWQGVSIGEGGFCNLPTSDGGKPCTDSKQCENMCVQVGSGSSMGKCYEWKSSIDTCITPIHNGKAGFSMCAFE